jgi:ABC-2 type transport system permease protein
MRHVIGLIRKEFQQILRDRPMLMIIFVMPLVQLFLLGYAVTTDVRNLRLAVWDEDRSSLSRQTIAALQASGYFNIALQARSRSAAENAVQRGDADLAVLIPRRFSADLENGRSPAVQILVDGQNSNTSAIGLGYASRIMQEISKEILLAKIAIRAGGVHLLEARTRVFYNPNLESYYYMIPGIITVLVTVTTMLLTGMGLVREKEIGTFEQLIVTPIRPFQLLIGKLLPFAVIGFIELSVALLVGTLWFGIPFEGNPGLILLATVFFLLNTLGIGLFISTVTSTQQQALFVAWFMMVFCMLMSGFFYPIENMPGWAQDITLINPLRYYLSILREVFLKGSHLRDLLMDYAMLALLGSIILSVTVARFRARL